MPNLVSLADFLGCLEIFDGDLLCESIEESNSDTKLFIDGVHKASEHTLSLGKLRYTIRDLMLQKGKFGLENNDREFVDLLDDQTLKSELRVVQGQVDTKGTYRALG